MAIDSTVTHRLMGEGQESPGAGERHRGLTGTGAVKPEGAVSGNPENGWKGTVDLIHLPHG